jgi:hypothetical protein
MPNMKPVGQRNLKLLGGQGKTDGRPDVRPAGQTDVLTDKLILVNPPYNFVARGYKNYSNAPFLALISAEVS